MIFYAPEIDKIILLRHLPYEDNSILKIYKIWESEGLDLRISEIYQLNLIFIGDL